MKYILILLQCVVLFPFCLFAASYCEQQLSKEDKPDLTLYTEHWPPYQRVENDRLTGISVEKIEQVLTAVNWPYKIQVVPWARALEQTKNEPNNFIFSLARFPERESNFQWVAPLASVTSKLYRFNNQKNINLNSLQDIKNYTLILKRGEASSTFFIENNLVNLDTVIWITQSNQALNLLHIGRGDLYPETVDGFHEAIKSSSFVESQFSEVFDFKELDVDLYLAASTVTPKSLIKRLSTVFSCVDKSN